VAAAQIALEGATQELAVGTRITLDVLDQERELLEARLGQVDAERQYYIAAHQLLAAMGRLRPEIIAK
jgi:outer membrane protein